MSKSIIVAYATSYGSTQEVAEVVAEVLRQGGRTVDFQPMREVHKLKDYGAAVLGAPLFMYHWHKDAMRFLSRHRKDLMKMQVAIFALGPVRDPHDEKEWQDSREQLEKELAKHPWFTPNAKVMFGGKFDPAKLRFPLNKFAGAEPASDIRDWTAIRLWASELAAQLESDRGSM